MRRILGILTLLFLATATTVGCASTTVKKNPGPHDRGVRFYRPKPYLLLEPAVVGGVLQYNAVTISLEWLPDYSEEYSVHVRAGIGKNKTTLVLKDGWNLTKVTSSLDSKTSENIAAFTSLAKALRPLGGGTPPGDTPTGAENEKGVGQVELLASNVSARNVPLGYYEAVIATSPDGCKRLHGWRYIGFSPYAPCPTCPSGVLTEDCTDRQVYGLVAEDGVMVFKLLDEIAGANVDAPRPTTGPASEELLKKAVATRIGNLVGHFATALGISRTSPSMPVVSFEVKGSTVTFTATRRDSLTQLSNEYLKSTWTAQLTAALESLTELRDKTFTVEVKPLPKE